MRACVGAFLHETIFFIDFTVSLMRIFVRKILRSEPLVVAVVAAAECDRI